MKLPRDMGAAEVEAFLTHLAVQKNVAPSPKKKALSTFDVFVSLGVSTRYRLGAWKNQVFWF